MLYFRPPFEPLNAVSPQWWKELNVWRISFILWSTHASFTLSPEQGILIEHAKLSLISFLKSCNYVPGKEFMHQLLMSSSIYLKHFCIWQNFLEVMICYPLILQFHCQGILWDCCCCCFFLYCYLLPLFFLDLCIFSQGGQMVLSFLLHLIHYGVLVFIYI